MSAPTMKPSEALRKARELITPEGAWSQGDLARDAHNSVVGAKSPHAVCWCAEGALQAAVFAPYASHQRVDYPMRFLRRVIEEHQIWIWNDKTDRTHAEVLDAFTRAIALAESEGQ